jgi:hypothetical protein
MLGFDVFFQVGFGGRFGAQVMCQREGIIVGVVRALCLCLGRWVLHNILLR